GRIEAPEWHNDWAIDYGVDSHGGRIVLTFIESAMNRPYTVQVVITAFGNPDATARYLIHKALGFEAYYAHDIADLVAEALATNDLRVVLGNRNPHLIQFPVEEPETDAAYDVRLESRLLGADTGSDVLIDLSNLLREAKAHMRDGMRPMTVPETRTLKTALDSLGA